MCKAGAFACSRLVDSHYREFEVLGDFWDARPGFLVHLESASCISLAFVRVGHVLVHVVWLGGQVGSARVSGASAP
jgi:hypothetical protein